MYGSRLPGRFPTMIHRTLLIAALGLATAPGCKKESTDDGPPAAPKVEPAAVTPPAPEPAAPAYSEDQAAALVGELASCQNPYSCEPLKTLVSFGDKVSGALADIAIDTGKSKEQRQIALHGLTEIKDPAVGIRLFEAGKTEKDFILRGDLFKAAGASGGDDTFAAMIAEYSSDASKEYRTELGFGVKAFDKATIFAYVSSNYPAAEKDQVRFANLVQDSATDAAAVQPLLEKTKHSMARHRLASTMVALGDTSKLDILIAGLDSKDEYDRSDAGNMLARVVDKVPADRKAEVVDLATKAKARDKGGLTSVGYDKILKALVK